MKARFVQDGKYLDYTPEAAVEAGDVVIVGSIVGVANRPIPAGETGAIATEGVFEIEKDGNAITAGATVYYDAGAGKATATATSNTALGVAVAAAEAEDAYVRVKLGVIGAAAGAGA